MRPTVNLNIFVANSQFPPSIDLSTESSWATNKNDRHHTGEKSAMHRAMIPNFPFVATFV